LEGKKEKGKTEPKGKARRQWSQQQAGSHTIALHNREGSVVVVVVW
jgi:hypothetical protein